MYNIVGTWLTQSNENEHFNQQNICLKPDGN